MDYSENNSHGTNNTFLRGPLGIYVNEGSRFWINESGKTSISYAPDFKEKEDEGYVFQVSKCANKCLKGETKQRLLALDGNGNLYIYGTLHQNGLASSNFKISFLCIKRRFGLNGSRLKRLPWS